MIGFFLIMMVITSVIYPAVITAAANVAFGSKAQGPSLQAMTERNTEAPAGSGIYRQPVSVGQDHECGYIYIYR